MAVKRFLFVRRSWLLATLLSSSPLVAQRKIERRMPLGMEGALRVINMVGSVVVHGWDRDTVLIRGTMSPVDRAYGGGAYTGVKFGIESGSEADPKPAHLEIWVPSGVRLWLKTATASIDVSGVDGGLDLYVVSGTIDVSGNPHELNAEAIDGDIHISGAPAWVRAKSASGTITFRGASSDAAFSTVSGAIKVAGGVFERTKIETVTGDIAFSARLDRSGQFDFDTHSGAVDIAIPEKVSASVSIETVTGTISNRISDESPKPGRFGRGAELITDLNGGGAKISVRTFKGAVTLRNAVGK